MGRLVIAIVFAALNSVFLLPAFSSLADAALMAGGISKDTLSLPVVGPFLVLLAAAGTLLGLFMSLILTFAVPVLAVPCRLIFLPQLAVPSQQTRARYSLLFALTFSAVAAATMLVGTTIGAEASTQRIIVFLVVTGTAALNGYLTSLVLLITPSELAQTAKWRARLTPSGPGFGVSALVILPVFLLFAAIELTYAVGGCGSYDSCAEKSPYTLVFSAVALAILATSWCVAAVWLVIVVLRKISKKSATPIRDN